MMLARTVAHTTDVDGMLASMTPQQFEEWMAFYKVQPWGGDVVQRTDEPRQGTLSAIRATIGV